LPTQAEIAAASNSYWGAFVRADVATMALHETDRTAIIDNGTQLPPARERFASIRDRVRSPTAPTQSTS
jgi:hypothetical protein